LPSYPENENKKKRKITGNRDVIEITFPLAKDAHFLKQDSGLSIKCKLPSFLV